MSHKPLDQYFVLNDGNVRTTGGSLSLTLGEFAIVNEKSPTKDGARVVTSFDNATDRDRFALRVGTADTGVTRSEDNKSSSSLLFQIGDVKKIVASTAQNAKAKFDEQIIGWNGTDGTEITLENGSNEAIELTLHGAPIATLGIPENKFVVRVNLEAPNTGEQGVLAPGDAGYDATAWTEQEIVLNAVRELKRYTLPGNVPLTNYVTITPVDSTKPNEIIGAGTYKSYDLIVSDKGDQSSLGKVQAQYPDLAIVRKSYDFEDSVYSVLKETGAPTAFQPKAKSLLKGCETCPAGYSELTQGVVYQVAIEDDGADSTLAVETLAGATVGSAVKNADEFGVSFYSVVTDDVVTDAELQTFLDANTTAKVELISEDVLEVCQAPTPDAIAWVEQEGICDATTETYTIQLRDTECGDSRLAELQAAYPDNTITETTVLADTCQRVYSTVVTSDVVCEECGEAFNDIYTTEAPKGIDGKSWTKVPVQYDGTAKMGIRVVGKPFILNGNEQLRDEMPAFNTSTRIQLAGGMPNFYNESFDYGRDGRMTVTVLSIAVDPQNIGATLRKYEDEGRVYFEGRNRHAGNNYGKWVYGEESLLNPVKQYIDYVVTIDKQRYAQSFQEKVNEALSYHIYVEVGKQGPLETVLNNLANAAGLPIVQAISKA